MAITFEKTSLTGHVPAIWRGEAKILPGGFQPLSTQNLALGTVLYRGTPIYIDFDNYTAAVCKSATVLTGGTTSKARVAKGHAFAAGDNVTVVGGEGTGTISSIDTSNAGYDVLNFSAAVTGATANAVLVEGTTAGTATYTPNAVVGADFINDGKGIAAIAAAYDCVVLKKHLKTPVIAAWLTAGSPCLKNNPNILFI